MFPNRNRIVESCSFAYRRRLFILKEDLRKRKCRGRVCSLRGGLWASGLPEFPQLPLVHPVVESAAHHHHHHHYHHHQLCSGKETVSFFLISPFILKTNNNVIYCYSGVIFIYRPFYEPRFIAYQLLFVHSPLDTINIINHIYSYGSDTSKISFSIKISW